MPTSGLRGFGLVELMVALTIASVLLAAAAPSMKVFIQNNRLHSTMYNLANDINLARGEAVKRKVRVVMCRSGNPLASTPSCGGSTEIWTTGWLIFASGDSNATYEPATDTLLAVRNPVEGATLQVHTNAASNHNLEYNPDGTTNESGATARFAICDERGGTVGRQLNVPPLGRLRYVQGSAGSPISCNSPS